METALIFNIFILFLISLIAYCTYKDYISYKSVQQSKFYSIFSLYTNGKSLINLKQADNSISCINGMKAISLPLIVFFHTLQWMMFKTKVLELENSEYYQNIKYRYLLTTAILPTETFFVISGFLSTKCFIQNETAITKLLKIYYHRYMRLTPTVVFIVIFMISITNFNGIPYFFKMEKDRCMLHWLSLLLYTQTYFNPGANHMCIGPIWFASVSWHLFLVSPIILLFVKSRDQERRLMVMMIILFATHIPGIIKYGEVGELINTIQSYLYMETVSRSYPYLFGMFYYFEFFKFKEVSKSTRFYLWLTTTFTFILTLVILIGTSISMEPLSWIFLITRLLWPLALCWIIHASVLGFGGIVDRILSYKYFMPLSTISLGIYILNNHIATLFADVLLEALKDFSFAVKVAALCSLTYIISTILSAILYLCIEIPCYKLARLSCKS